MASFVLSMQTEGGGGMNLTILNTVRGSKSDLSYIQVEASLDEAIGGKDSWYHFNGLDRKRKVLAN